MKRDYYEILGISKNASTDEIKKAYRTLARKFHPDVNKEPGAEAKFKEINEAYSALSDSGKRAQYDQFGQAGPQFGGAGFEGFDFSDLFRGGFAPEFGGSPFEDLFETFFGGGGRRKTGPRRGDDLQYDMNITLEEAAKGLEKEIEIPHYVACQTCKGSGARPGTSPVKCGTCKGSGQVRRAQRTMLGSFTQITPCPDCQGTGEVITSLCVECHGKGQVKKLHKVGLNVPAGVDTGNKLRIPKAGDAGESGGGPGDLYIFITVKRHSLFERDGVDIHYKALLSFSQASLGTELEVPTIDGKTLLKVPAGTQPNTVLRMKEKGMPHLNSRARGDQYVHIEIETPINLTREQSDLLKKFAQMRGEAKK
ncbi:MAG: molecular chaperone DnaJ [bacterium]